MRASHAACPIYHRHGDPVTSNYASALTPPKPSCRGNPNGTKPSRRPRRKAKSSPGFRRARSCAKRSTRHLASAFPASTSSSPPARGPTNASKIAAEHAAGVRYFDVLISGSLTPLSLLNAGILEPIEPLLILPEVKDPKRWYGGHIWADNAKRYLYSFQAYQSENLWHNTQLMKADEYRVLRRPAQSQMERQNRHPRSRAPPAAAHRPGRFFTKSKAKNFSANWRRKSLRCRASNGCSAKISPKDAWH